ncbi:phosphonate ABC transporter ATP-binding protein [Poseidonibacter antarcticus]|uniref:phosphonate ABC transporter ATP-binding protein n=1 Tax=Poseidonibacter antarcticus TaxID=2478538 RepID=UPI000EF4DAE3|nr:phosphonate ABC transporter ATP-binding protein [Poseidonibacter antarcticus]
MIKMKNLTLGYKKEKILSDVSIKIKKGEFIGIIGPSGAGKSTLLMAVTGGIKVFDGKFEVLDYDLENIKKKNLIKLREQIGVIFQGYNLVDRISVLDNVISGTLKDIPLTRAIIKLYKKKELQKAKEYMDIVDMTKHSLKRCDELSGGQRQRVAIARALAAEPKIILADEPVSALDPKSAKKIMSILKKVNETYGVTVIANLHHLEYANEYCDRIIGVNNGTVVFDDKSEKLTDELVEKIYANNEKA